MLERTHPSRLTSAEVLDRVLDKGIVIDALSHVSLAGTQLVTFTSHVVVASIETYLNYFGEDVGVESPPLVDDEQRPRTLREAPRLVDFPAFLPD